jgi:hypothetical protein
MRNPVERWRVEDLSSGSNFKELEIILGAHSVLLLDSSPSVQLKTDID